MPDPFPRALSRRALLAGGAGAAALALSGCVTSDAGDSAPTGGVRYPPRRPPALPRDVLVRGANITVKESYYPRPWHNLWAEWDWTNWIKWQVDLARTLGVNCIRLLGSVSVVAEKVITSGQNLARWRQLLDYLAAGGMWAYPCVSDLRHWGDARLAQAVDLYRTVGAVFEGYPNVIGVDVSNEAQLSLDAGWSAAELRRTLDALVPALRATTSKPLAHSVTIGHEQDWFLPWVSRLTELSQFADVHVYFTPSTTDAGTLFSRSEGDQSLIIGEFGVGIDEPSNARTAFYGAVRDLIAGDARFAGGLAWDIAEDNFGLFDASGHPRVDITQALMTFPVHR